MKATKRVNAGLISDLVDLQGKNNKLANRPILHAIMLNV